MSGHLSLRTGNPALRAETFNVPRPITGDDAMTVNGVVNKTAISLVILFATASYTWSLGPESPQVSTWMIVGFLGGFVVAIATVFKKTWAPVTTPAYAALEGLALGGLSVIFESRYPGIASQAIFLTFGTLGGLLMAYRSGWIRATENFKLGILRLSLRPSSPTSIYRCGERHEKSSGKIRFHSGRRRGIHDVGNVAPDLRRTEKPSAPPAVACRVGGTRPERTDVLAILSRLYLLARSRSWPRPFVTAARIRALARSRSGSSPPADRKSSSGIHRIFRPTAVETMI